MSSGQMVVVNALLLISISLFYIVVYVPRRQRAELLKNPEVRKRIEERLKYAFPWGRHYNPDLAQKIFFEELEAIRHGKTPPLFATYLLYFLPKKQRESIIGDLEEEYLDVYNRFGCRKAVVWYYWQVVASFWPFISQVVGKLLKWGIVGWVGSIIRRFIA